MLGRSSQGQPALHGVTKTRFRTLCERAFVEGACVVAARRTAAVSVRHIECASTTWTAGAESAATVSELTAVGQPRPQRFENNNEETTSDGWVIYERHVCTQELMSIWR